MSTLLKSGKHLELRQWEPSKKDGGNNPWEYAKRLVKNAGFKDGDDESALIAAVINPESERPEVILQLSNRPIFKKPNWEVIGGLNSDSDSDGNIEKTADKETEEEAGATVIRNKKLDTIKYSGLSSSAGMTDETNTLKVREVQNLEKAPEDTGDPITLQIVKLPLEQASNFLLEQSQKGFHVAISCFAALYNAMKACNIQPDFEAKGIKATTIWDAKDSKEPTEYQKRGLEKLSEMAA